MANLSRWRSRGVLFFLGGPLSDLKICICKNRVLLVHFKACVGFFIFSPNGTPPKTMKNAFYFIFLLFWIFLKFFPSFQYFPDSKGQIKVEQFMMSWTDSGKVADVIFRIIQKLLYITSSNLVRYYITNKGIFVNFFSLKSHWLLAPGPFCFS